MKIRPTVHFSHAFALMCLAFMALPHSVAAAPSAPIQHAPATNSIAALDAELLEANAAVVRAFKAFRKGKHSADRDSLRRQLQEAAQTRRVRFQNLMQVQPKLALARTLPARLRDRLPPEVQILIEQEVEVSGKVEITHTDDFRNKVCKKTLHLKTSGSQHIELVGVEDEEKHALVGKQLTVKGVQVGRQILMAQRTVTASVAAPGQSTRAAGMARQFGQLAAMSAPAEGDAKRILSVIVHLSNASNTCSVDSLRATIFGDGVSAKTAISQASRGKAVLTEVAILAPIRLAVPREDMPFDDKLRGLIARARDHAKSMGYDPSRYDILNVSLPYDIPTSWWGKAGSDDGLEWNTLACGAPVSVYAHEMGHNLGMGHAGAYLKSGEFNDYADSSDFMSETDKMVRLNAPHVYMQQWLTEGAVREVSTGGSFRLKALGQESGDALQVLRIPIPDSSNSYFLSWRKRAATGDWDSELPTEYNRKLNVHIADTNSRYTPTRLRELLSSGGKFVDAAAGVSIAHEWNNTSESSVKVEFLNKGCERKAPTLTIANASRMVLPGESVQFDVNLKNNNTAACGASGFNLAQPSVAGFSVKLDRPMPSLAPGSSGTARFTMQAGSSLADGSYAVKFSAQDSAAAENMASADATITVASDKLGPALTLSAPASNAELVSGRSYSLLAKASDAGGVKNVAFRFETGERVIALGEGKAQGGDNYGLSWTVPNDLTGSGNLRVEAVDKLGNRSEISVPMRLASSCVRNAPLLRLVTPTASVSPGGSRTLSVEVTNRNTSGCGGSSFGLTASLPNGVWGQGVSAFVLAGQTAAMNFPVNVSSSMAAGKYAFSLTTAEADVPAGKAVVTGELTIDPVDTQGPTLTIISPQAGASLAQGQAYDLRATASDVSGVQSVEFAYESAGKVVSMGQGRLDAGQYVVTWIPGPSLSAGDGVIRVTARDTRGNQNEARLTVSLQQSSAQDFYKLRSQSYGAKALTFWDGFFWKSDYAGTDAQKYTLVAAGAPDTFWLKNKDGRCVEVPGGSATPGAKLSLGTCGAGDHQKWVRLTQAGSAAIGLRNAKTGYCMHASSTLNGRVQQSTCNANDSLQQWLYEAAGG